MHLCFSCISYLSFGTEIEGETKPQPCFRILTNISTLDQFIGYIVIAEQGHQKIVEVMMLIKIIEESVKFIGSKYTQQSLIKFKTILINSEITTTIQLTTERSVPWSDLNFPKACSKTLLDSRSYQPYAAVCCRGNSFNRKRKTTHYVKKAT